MHNVKMRNRNQLYHGSKLGKLTSTKGPHRSEMTSRVQGCVKSVEEQHRKQVELMFRDRNAVLNRVNKSQAQVYRTMLRVHKEKKILERDRLRRHVQASKGQHVTDSDRASIVVCKDAAGTQTTALQEDTHRDAAPNAISQELQCQEAHAIPDCCIKQREDFKQSMDNSASLSREGTKTEIDVSTKTKVRSLTLPLLEETNDLARKHSWEKKSEVANKALYLVKVRESENSVCSAVHNVNGSCSWPGPGPDEAVTAASCHATRNPANLSHPSEQPAVVESEVQSTGRQCCAADYHSSTCNALGCHTSDLSGNHSPRKQPSSSDPRSSHSVRRLSYQPGASRNLSQGQTIGRNTLDQEPVTVYVMDDYGNIVPAENNKQYERQTFPMPSLRQQHQQQKLLQTELSAAGQHKEKADRFLERLDNEKYESVDPHRRHLAKMAATKVARPTERKERTGGITLSELAAVFQWSDKLAEGVDPNSVEAVKICKYVRKFRPLIMSKEDRQRAKVNKLSSWHHAK